MLAAHDQENLVHGHQTVAAAKPLNQGTRTVPPKTPGNRYPKTPLKIPLQDENSHAVLGGKSVLGHKGKDGENAITGGKKGSTFDKNAFVTPMAPRNRAPLGVKTTNAKAKAFQTPAGPALDKDLDKTQLKPTSARRPKPKVSHAETIKLNVHGDDVDPLEEREVEYAPPKPVDLPYQSDVLPEGIFDSDMLKGPNLMRGWHKYYFDDPVDENGVSLKEKKMEEELAKALRETDERVLKALEDADWSVGDVPETFANKRQNNIGTKSQGNALQKNKKVSVTNTRGPGTIASRNAASLLSANPPATSARPQNTKISAPVKPATSFMSRTKKVPVIQTSEGSRLHQTPATMASRSTIGYNKGRTASNILRSTGGLVRSTSNLSTGSDTTITPARQAQKDTEAENERRNRLKFLGAFDSEDEDLEPGLRGAVPECLRNMDDEDDEFVLTLEDN